jgi:hypothetical protein
MTGMKPLLREVLEFVKDKARAFTGDTPVALSHTGENQNTLLMSVCNIRFEQASRASTVVVPPLHLDLYVLFYANFSERKYYEGLDALADVVTFISENPVLSSEALGRVVLEIVNLDLDQLRHLMSMVGRIYLPSVLCRVRVTPPPDSD